MRISKYSNPKTSEPRSNTPLAKQITLFSEQAERVKFLLDTQLPPKLADVMQSNGYEAVHAIELLAQGHVLVEILREDVH